MSMSKILRLRPLAGSLMLAFAASSSVVQALPQGGVQVAGSVSASTSGSTTTVTQTSASAIMNWQSFSVAANERVNFIQPSASASILNRVTGSDPSSILGQITANGRVFLVNPNGIIFGHGSRIDAAGLIASTANISNANFMAGNYKFDEVTNRLATIVNRGEISVAQGGLVALVAPGIENSGIIRADLGRVALASGNAFSLDLFGDKLVSFAVNDTVAERLTDANGVKLAAYVSNTGTITADGGSVLITANVARSVVDSAINMAGVVRASNVAQHNGEIVLSGGDGAVNVSGTLDAAGRDGGTAGGSIVVTGRDITLAGSAKLDVSGDNGGGSIKVGGDYQGSGTLAHADTTRVAAGAALNADGGSTGNGGMVVLWSDQRTTFEGNISARGGQKVGAGGTAETSSKGVLEYRGNVDLAAPNGAGGFLLLDPVELTIDATAAASLSTTMRGGASATATTTGGDLVVASRIDGRGGSAGGGLTLTSGAGISVNADIYTNNGAVTMTAANGGITMAATGGTATTQTLIYTGSGAINMTATNGTVSTQHLLTSGAVALTTNTSGNVTLNQNLGGTSGLGSLTAASAGDVTLTSIRTTGNISATSGAASLVNVNGTLVSGGNIELGTAGGSVKLRHNVQATGSVTFNADVYVNPEDEIIAQTAGGYVSASTPTAFASLMTGVTPFGGNTFTNGTYTAQWDPVAVRGTVKAGGAVVFNKGLLWDGAAGSTLSFQYYAGENSTAFAPPTQTARSDLPAKKTGYFVLDFQSASVTFAGTGLIGWDTGSAPAFTYANPSGVGGWCTDGTSPGFGMTLTSSVNMSVTGTYTNSAITPATRVLASTGTNSAIGLSNGTGNGNGAFTVPSAASGLSAVSLSLSDISLPSVSSLTSAGSNVGGLVNSLENSNESSTGDAEGGNTGSANDPLEVANMGRGGAGSGQDPFSQNFQLVGGGGAFGGNDYFTANLFDFAASKSKSGSKDDDRR